MTTHVYVCVCECAIVHPQTQHSNLPENTYVSFRRNQPDTLGHDAKGAKGYNLQWQVVPLLRDGNCKKKRLPTFVI